MITVGDQTVTVSNPSMISIAGSTLLVGGNSVKVSGSVLSLTSNSHLFVDIDENSARKEAANANSDSFVSTDSRELVIGVMILRPSGSVIDVAGTPMRRAEAGRIFVGDIDPPRLLSILTNVAESEIVPPGDSRGLLIDGSTTIAGHVLTRMPLVWKVGDVTLYPGGIGTTISGIRISLTSSGYLVIGRKTVKLPECHSSSFAISGHLFSAYFPGLLIDGISTTPGGSAIFLSGTPICLDSIGNLVIGSSTVKHTGLTTLAPLKSTVDRHVFAGNPSILLIDGKTLVAGGATTILSGTPISLDIVETLRLRVSEIPLTATGGTRGSSVWGVTLPEAFFSHTRKIL